MAQMYRDPIAHQRMAADTCPECGRTADEHSDSSGRDLIVYWPGVTAEEGRS